MLSSFTKHTRKRVVGEICRHLHVCDVGTGPAGFYTAKYLLKEHPQARVDLIDRLPTPFGLVRSGVAPDHPEVKSVQNDFTEIVEQNKDRVSFVGNLEVGKDISLGDLRKCYNAVVLAYGSDEDRRLGLQGEESLKYVDSARAFVNWYNGHPDWVDFEPNLDAKDVVIIGQGNVAIDCARILCKTVEELQKTDIAQHALDALSSSRVERVHVIGRRGHVQAACTTKELRELTKLDAADLLVRADELEMGMSNASAEELSGSGGRAAKRQTKILNDAAKLLAGSGRRELHMRYLLSPKELVAASDDSGVVDGIVLERNRLEGDAGAQRAVGTGELESIPCGMLLRSIGYASVSIDDDLPFDTKRHVVANEIGRVSGEAGLYCAGWLKRGPSGIIGTNIVDARQTVAAILEDASNNAIPSVASAETGVAGLDAVRSILRKGSEKKVIGWNGYVRIDAHEVRAGEAVGKPREKIISIPEMIEIAADGELSDCA